MCGRVSGCLRYALFSYYFDFKNCSFRVSFVMVKLFYQRIGKQENEEKNQEGRYDDDYDVEVYYLYFLNLTRMLSDLELAEILHFIVSTLLDCM